MADKPLTFYMDAHVPRGITIGLRRRGVNVLTAQEDGAESWPDDKIIQRSIALGRILFTSDFGNVPRMAKLIRDGRHNCGAVIANVNVSPIGACVNDLELIARVLTLDEMKNSIIHIPF